MHGRERFGLCVASRQCVCICSVLVKRHLGTLLDSGVGGLSSTGTGLTCPGPVPTLQGTRFDKRVMQPLQVYGQVLAQRAGREGAHGAAHLSSSMASTASAISTTVQHTDSDASDASAMALESPDPKDSPVSCLSKGTTKQRWRLTSLGRALALMPLDPAQAKMLMMAALLG